MSDPHSICEDPHCAICLERERLAALDLERKLRPAGSIRLQIARIKEKVRRLHSRQGSS